MTDPQHGHGRAVDFQPFSAVGIGPWVDVIDEHRRFVDGLHAAPTTDYGPGSEWAKRRQAAQLRKGEILAAYARIVATEGIAGLVLEQHAPTSDRRYCTGCDMGCSCEAADWPCSTVRLILQHDGVDLTDIDLIHWEGEL